MVKKSIIKKYRKLDKKIKSYQFQICYDEEKVTNFK